MIEEKKLPKDWKFVKLKDVCKKIVGGGTPSTAIKEYWEGDVPWISSADILGLKEIVLRRKISKKAIENSTTNLLPKGGIIVVTRVGLGKIAIAPYEICFSQDNQGLVLNETLISQSYALICLSRAVQKFKSESRGTTINGVTKKQLEELEIPLPPLTEQQNIVGKVDELSSDLDKGIESLKTAQQQLKVYRQAVLKYAFEGKLTEKWRKEHNKVSPTRIEPVEVGSGFEPEIVPKRRLEHAQKLEKTKNKGVRFPLPVHNMVSPTGIEPVENTGVEPVLPEGWKWNTINEIADKITDGEHFRPKTQEKGIPFLSAKDVRDEGVSFDNPLFISVETANKALLRCNPQRGDILIVSRGATVGRMCIVNTDEKFCLLGSVILIKAKKSMSSKYINYVLKSPFANQKMISISGATAQQAIYLRDIKNILIPICSIDEENQIIQEIERRLSVCDKLEETITNTLKESETLRQSILKKAFEGRLG